MWKVCDLWRIEHNSLLYQIIKFPWFKRATRILVRASISLSLSCSLQVALTAIKRQSFAADMLSGDR